jgi:hypothetical protein
MPTAIDDVACRGQEGGLLPVSPFTALQYHFGMLLGVDDLETAQAYPRGKQRLHNAWLHREGVVWGFNVSFNARNELAVDRGLALDAAGHELHLDIQACLDVGKWYAEESKKTQSPFTFTDTTDGGKRFGVRVVARFKACLTRPVPAIADPCAGAETDTAYSRAFETVELLLRPLPPAPPAAPYHRLRVLFRLEPDSAAYDDVRVKREEILAKPAADQPQAYLAAFREFAALDEIDLVPAQTAAGEPTSIFPENDDTELLLAVVDDIVIKPAAGATWAITTPVPVPNVRVRPSHVATRTIQELLCGPLFGPGGTGPGPGPGPADAGGPRIDPASLKLNPKSLTFTVTKALHDASVDVGAFSVTSFDVNDGWSDVDLKKAAADAAHTKVTLDFKEAPTGARVRLVARGTGPTPLLGADYVPFAGAIGGPAGTTHDGHDFAFIWERS